MFSTHNAFRFPLQTDPDWPVWSAVELALTTPLFIATIKCEGSAPRRTFLLHGTRELLALTSAKFACSIASLVLLQPPAWSQHQVWSCVKMEMILLQEAPPDGAAPSAVARGEDGTLYGGFPVQSLIGDPGPLTCLSALEA